MKDETKFEMYLTLGVMFPCTRPSTYKALVNSLERFRISTMVIESKASLISILLQYGFIKELNRSSLV